MHRHLLPILSLSLLSVGCAEEVVDEEPFAHTFVIESIEIDPTSALGGAVGSAPVFQLVPDSLQFVDCDGLVPLLLDFGGSRIGSSGRGEARLYFSQHVDPDSSCSGNGRFLIDPFSVDSDGSAETSGPLWLEGPSFEGRLDPGLALRTAFGVRFEDWVTVSGVMHGNPPSIDFGRIGFLWTVDYLHGLYNEPTDQSWLDGAVLSFGATPDVDRDADGIERFFDMDGDRHIDRCIDGDGTIVDGADCPLDARFADGFTLAFLYRVQPAEIAGTSEVTFLGDGVLERALPTR